LESARGCCGGAGRQFTRAPEVDHLDLVLTNGYLGKLLSNARVVRYLAQHHRDILTEFQKLAEMETAAA